MIGRPRPGVKTLNLCGLEDGDAFLLWESYGMRGSPQSLRGLFQSIDGHLLVIQAAAAALADYPPANRDYDQYILRRPDFNPSGRSPAAAKALAYPVSCGARPQRVVATGLPGRRAVQEAADLCGS